LPLTAPSLGRAGGDPVLRGKLERDKELLAALHRHRMEFAATPELALVGNSGGLTKGEIKYGKLEIPNCIRPLCRGPGAVGIYSCRGCSCDNGIVRSQERQDSEGSMAARQERTRGFELGFLHVGDREKPRAFGGHDGVLPQGAPHNPRPPPGCAGKRTEGMRPHSPRHGSAMTSSTIAWHSSSRPALPPIPSGRARGTSPSSIGRSTICSAAPRG
jgi:hypothetical protein